MKAKPKKPYAGKIPFDKDGHMMDCVAYWNEKDVVTWKDNTPFRARMTITDYFRGRSAAGFNLVDGWGKKHAMRMQHFTKMIVACDCQAGVVEGMWQYAKQGSAYSLVYLGAMEALAV